MNDDDFLHRLRKAPRPEFAVRLRAQLRRQSMSLPPPKVPSRTRTLLTLLLLGGSAFAITAVAMRGLPPSLLVLYQHAATWLAAERATHREHHPADAGGIVQGLRWGGSGYSPAHGAAPPGSGTTQSGLPTTSAQSGATPSGTPAARSSSVGGAPVPLGISQITAVVSWSAYPYVTAFVAPVNLSNSAPHIDVSLRDSDSWPGPLCSGDAHAPDLAYAFEPAGSTISMTCPRQAGRNPVAVKAVPIGYEAIAIARSPLYGELDVTRRQMFLALAKWVPDPARAGTVHANTSKTWRQVDATLGPEPLELMGPPLSSAEGRSMIELLMEAGCDTYPWIAALESTHPDRYARICRTVRTDGVYTEASGLSSTALLAEPNAVGIFAFASWNLPFLEALSMSKLDGVAPTMESVESGVYPGSRTLYLYATGRPASQYIVFRLLMGGDFGTYPDWALIYPWPLRQRAMAQIERAAR